MIAASAAVFQAMKWAGVAYLVWLGVQSWRRSGRPAEVRNVGAVPAARIAYRQGFLLGIANPKVVLFFLAFLPQFLDRSAPAWEQLLILGALFALVGISCDAAFCFGAGCLRRLFARVRPGRVARKLPALTYFGLAGWAATTGQRAM